MRAEALVERKRVGCPRRRRVPSGRRLLTGRVLSASWPLGMPNSSIYSADASGLWKVVSFAPRHRRTEIQPAKLGVSLRRKETADPIPGSC